MHGYGEIVSCYWEKLEDGYELSGDLITADIPQLQRAVNAVGARSIQSILMRDLEIEDGVTMALLVTLLRSIAPVTLIEAPKMLAHTLYKIDGLRDFKLVRPRQDES